jgi:hypothetical protein
MVPISALPRRHPNRIVYDLLTHPSGCRAAVLPEGLNAGRRATRAPASVYPLAASLPTRAIRVRHAPRGHGNAPGPALSKGCKLTFGLGEKR